jgi:hypothetical protein
VPDAAVAPPPKVDAASVTPPMPDAAVISPPKLDAAPTTTQRPDAAAPPRLDASEAPPDAAPEEPEPDAATSTGSFGGSGPGPGRAPRPGARTGCALALQPGTSSSWIALLTCAVVLAFRRRRPR